MNDVNSDFSKPSTGSHSCSQLEGVANIISKAGGHGIRNDYKRLKKCDVGSVVIGRGFDLPCEWVIHAASPTFLLNRLVMCSVSYTRIHPTELEESQLASCYREALMLCIKKKIHTVAFPCLGTRAHRYPIDEASKTEVRTILNVLNEHPEEYERVILCTHNPRDTKVVSDTVELLLKDLE